LNVFSNYLLNLGETFKEFMEKNGKKVLCLSFFTGMEEHHTKRNPRMVKTMSLGMPKEPHWTLISNLSVCALLNFIF
jgi:hypothetical protein